jgi:RNA polymerase sigma factor (sigma-70 family)
LLGLGTVAGLSEWQLLNRYISRGDEAAFEALVARHGPMVLGVCRRLLADPHDAEDASQATFLVLVRKAGSLGEHDAIGHWLYGVARRVALKARGQAARRRTHEPRLATDPPAPPFDPAAIDLGPALDAELDRLPAKYRAPIVLCYLEGLTHEQAASALRWPLGTVKGRLARARDLLRDRLIRRGIALSAGALAGSLSRDAACAVPEALLDSTVQAALRFASGPLSAGIVSAPVAALIQGVLTTMFVSKVKTAAALTAACLALLAASAGVIAQQATDERPDRRPDDRAAVLVVKEETRPAEERIPASARALEIDLDAGVETSPGELARSQRELASRIFANDLRTFTKHGTGEIKDLAQWSVRILEASDMSTPENRLAAVREHHARMQAVTEAVMRQRTSGTRGALPNDLLMAKYFLHDAAQQLAQVKTESNAPPAPAAHGAGTTSGSDDPRSRKILAKLEEPITMPFDSETPLEDVLKYIKGATTGPNDAGIPIYVDPIGLQEAEKTMTSPITLDLDGVPLKTTLTLLLRQLGLVYRVKDGLMIITFDGDDFNDEPDLDDLMEKAERGRLTPDELRTLTSMLKTLNEVQKLRLEGNKTLFEIEKLEEETRNLRPKTGNRGGGGLQ